jgi:hypothetical protein
VLELLLFAATITPQQEVQRQCSRCHSLGVVRKQRLSREEWDDEVRKMEKLGAALKNREAVIAYLASKYSDQAPRRGKK